MKHDPPPAEDEPKPTPPGRTDARVAVALAGPILFTPPVLALFDRPASVFGVPTLITYVFLAWLAGIVITALAARRRG